MKKKILYFTAMCLTFIFAMFVFQSTSFAGTQKLLDVNYDVQLNADGTAEVTEDWNVKISDTNTLFKTFELDSSKYGEIIDVSVAEISNLGEKIDFIDTGAYAYHVQKRWLLRIRNKLR